MIKVKDKKNIKEAVDINKVVKDLQGNFGGSNEEQMAGVQLLKGLATSDEKIANDFMKKLDTVITKISKEVLGGKKEEVSESIILKNDIRIGDQILEKGDRIIITKKNKKQEAINLNVFQKHQFSIAKKTLKMSDVGASIMGGMTKDEAEKFLYSIGYTQNQIDRLKENKKQEAVPVERNTRVVDKVIEYLYARHYRDIRTAKQAKAWLQKKLGRKFNSLLMKFGNPDAGNFDVVFNKWNIYMGTLREKKESMTGSSTHLEKLLKDLFRSFGLKVKWTVDSIEIEMPSENWYWDEFSQSGKLEEFNSIVRQFNVDYDIVDDTIIVFI